MANLTRYIPIRVYDYYAPGKYPDCSFKPVNVHFLSNRTLQPDYVQHTELVLLECVPRLRVVPVSVLSHLQSLIAPSASIGLTVPWLGRGRLLDDHAFSPLDRFASGPAYQLTVLICVQKHACFVPNLVHWFVASSSSSSSCPLPAWHCSIITSLFMHHRIGC